jgi:hypothetical protein
MESLEEAWGQREREKEMAVMFFVLVLARVLGSQRGTPGTKR